MSPLVRPVGPSPVGPSDSGQVSPLDRIAKMSIAATSETKRRQTRRWWRAGLLALLLLLLAFPGYVAFEDVVLRRPGVTLDNVRRLKVGMTEQEVEWRLGPPAKSKPAFYT